MFLDKEVLKLEQLGVIDWHLSACNSSVVIVPELRPGDDWRLCADFRDWDEITATIRYSMPLIDDILSVLGGATWFVKLDLAKGFW